MSRKEIKKRKKKQRNEPSQAEDKRCFTEAEDIERKIYPFEDDVFSCEEDNCYLDLLQRIEKIRESDIDHFS